MIISENSSYTSLKPAKSEDGKIKNILEFDKEFKKKYTNFKNENLILDFSEYSIMELGEILLFSRISEEHIKNNKSFIIVCKGMDIDLSYDDLTIVPTFQEAEDVIEIEEIERDLGI